MHQFRLRRSGDFPACQKVSLSSAPRVLVVQKIPLKMTTVTHQGPRMTISPESIEFHAFRWVYRSFYQI